MCSEIENEIHLMLDCPVYKDLIETLFLDILETDFTSLQLLGYYIYQPIKIRETALKGYGKALG